MINIWGILLAAIGFYFFGFFGAIFGYFVGSSLRVNTSSRTFTGAGSNSRFDNLGTDNFSAALLYLTSAVMKADGQIKKAELEVVKTFWKSQFGLEKTKKDMLILRDIMDKPVSIPQIAAAIRMSLPLEQRLFLMQYLFDIAKADGNIDSSELDVLRQIAGYMQISPQDFMSFQGVSSRRESFDPYKVLGIDSSASDAEVKKAYRSMAVKYHPDKVASLGEKHKEAAEEKFKTLQEAYEVIKKQRGL